jgi:hypothetical protein
MSSLDTHLAATKKAILQLEVKRTYIGSILIKFCPSYKLCDDPSSMENSSAAVQIKLKGGMNDRNDLTIMHSFFKFLTKDA